VSSAGFHVHSKIAYIDIGGELVNKVLFHVNVVFFHVHSKIFCAHVSHSGGLLRFIYMTGGPNDVESGNPVRKETTDMSEQTDVTLPGDEKLEAAIAEALARIKSVYELVPEFALAPAKGVQRPSYAVSDEFLEAAAVAREASPAMDAPLDPAKVREVINRNRRFEAVAAAAEALARDVRYNMLRERWSVAEDALQVYALSKAYTRKPQGAALAQHVRNMREKLGRAGVKRVPQQPPHTAVNTIE
jgi:hypothetical protein